MENQNMPTIPMPIEAMPEGEVCPVISGGMILAPVAPSMRLAVPQNNSPQLAAIRYYSPCIKERCALWNDAHENCGLVLKYGN